MTLPYFFRLSCLSMASFFVVHLAAALSVSAVLPSMLKRIERLRSRSAASLAFGLRMLPAAAALLAVAAVCASYLWLEPKAAAEKAGPECLLLALLGIGLLADSIQRAVRALYGSFRFLRECARLGREIPAPGVNLPMCVIDVAEPIVALAGIFRPRLIVAGSVTAALSPEELTAALGHEKAHHLSSDNLKRLLVLAAPGWLPFCRGFLHLECAWQKWTEWAADDRSVEGDPRRSLALASALVRVAKLGVSPQPIALMTSLVSLHDDLPDRVRRLLDVASVDARSKRWLQATGPVLAVLSVVPLLLWTAHPVTLNRVHSMLEHLMR